MKIMTKTDFQSFSHSFFLCQFRRSRNTTAVFRAWSQIQAGALVPGATLTSNQQRHRLSHRSHLKRRGYLFSLNSLAGGTYTITVEKPGFSKQVLENVLLQGETTQSLNVRLMVLSNAGQVVTVTGELLPVINTESADISGTITSKDVQNLPSFGRDPYNFCGLRLVFSAMARSPIVAPAAAFPVRTLAEEPVFSRWKTACR